MSEAIGLICDISLRRAAQAGNGFRSRSQLAHFPRTQSQGTGISNPVLNPSLTPCKKRSPFGPPQNMDVRYAITRMNQKDTSDRRMQANRSNAEKSTGPKTDAGKAITSLNAVKTGLTGRTVLLPSDDVARYEQHNAEWQTEWKPVGPREAALVQAIADSHWRAERIVCLEFALYAQGRVQFAEQVAATADPALQAQLLEAHTYLAYERQFRNLSIQEARLRRQRDKDETALTELQEQRRAAEAERQALLDKAAKRLRHARSFGTPFHPAADGFVFSMAEIEANYERLFGPDDEEEDEEDIPEPGSRWKPDAAA